MARERWQDNEKVKDALARVLCRICPVCGHGVTWHGDNHDDGCTHNGCECSLNARECDAKINDEANVYALVEAVAACGDASPSETTGAKAVACDVDDLTNIAIKAYNEDIASDGEQMLKGRLPYKSAMRKAVAAVLASAPPAGDGVPEVREEDVEHFKNRCSYEPDLGCPYCDRILAALSYCATRQGEGRYDFDDRCRECEAAKHDIVTENGKPFCWSCWNEAMCAELRKQIATSTSTPTPTSSTQGPK